MPTTHAEFTAIVHQEDGSYWAEVVELPGCFASGFDLDELKEALVESIQACVPEAENGGAAPASVQLSALRLLVGAGSQPID